jgi:hypothetical protein
VFDGLGDEIDGFGFEFRPDFFTEGEDEGDGGGEDRVGLDPGEGVGLEPGPERSQRRFEG